jgi:DNA-directed RNA polymerase subunit alpha
MVTSQDFAVKEILEDPEATRLEFLNARSLAYSIAGERQKTARLVEEWNAEGSKPLAAGVGLWILRRYEEAAGVLAEVDDAAEGAYFRGLCLIETGEYAEAVKALRAASKAGQNAFACDMAAAEAHRRAGQRDKALAILGEYEEDDVEEAELHYQKGRCLEDAYRYEAAMEAYERAVELDAQHAGALFRMGYWHDLRGNDDVAIGCYEKAAEVTPLFANVLLNLGMLYEDHGKYRQARRVYARLNAADPLNPRAKMYLQDAEASLAMYYDEATERRQHRTQALLKTPLSDFELSARSRACLDKMNIRTLGDLARLSEDELVQSKNFGETSLAELRRLLQSKGLHFGYGRADMPAAVEALSAPEESGLHAKSISDLDLSIRSQKCMRTLGLTTIGELIQRTERELLQCQNFGQTSLEEVKAKLDELGLELKSNK